MTKTLNDTFFEGDFLTFWLGSQMFGISVKQIQEVSNSLRIDPIPLAPSFIQGLINLRGQIILGIDLKQIFKIDENYLNKAEKVDSIVCNIDGQIYSFQVDLVGDVWVGNKGQFEIIPENVPVEFRDNCLGLFKMPSQLLFVLDLEHLKKTLNQQSESANEPSNQSSQGL